MAEFLLRAKDNTHSDPTKNRRGCYKKGDIVVVKSDGWTWGRLECWPEFVVVKDPNISEVDAKHFIESETETVGEVVTTLTRRRYKFDFEDTTKLSTIDFNALKIGPDWVIPNIDNTKVTDKIV